MKQGWQKWNLSIYKKVWSIQKIPVIKPNLQGVQLKKILFDCNN